LSHLFRRITLTRVTKFLASFPNLFHDYINTRYKVREKEFLMAKKLYVGNLSYGTSEDGLRNAFTQYGEVQSVNIVIDRDSGRSKGFGFVEMANDDAAVAAISGMNGRELDGRSLRVNEANERPPRRDYGNRW